MGFECVGAGLTTILSGLTQMRLNPPRLDPSLFGHSFERLFGANH
ncbi:hypothetical protein MC7420_2835 [Coleofasciculus chthonoplastes PCC 7420]|uniref:Uncharacterized protein n=1 Tax=Coleofasciculus chthonoplastes PCC 7420 TaxID=118168 RepID=B4VJZ7_9CYAN|nr:hypothetical protein MC7420_2835 [Coleofasciculus chthonoplastes PCC 7420]